MSFANMPRPKYVRKPRTYRTWSVRGSGPQRGRRSSFTHPDSRRARRSVSGESDCSRLCAYTRVRDIKIYAHFEIKNS